MQLQAKLNKRERRAQQLLAHYACCEALARFLGVAKPDGKKISVALLKAEQAGQKRAERICNDASYNVEDYDQDGNKVREMVRAALGKLPPGFFVNADPRGYCLKLDNENPQAVALIESIGMHTDWGRYGILSPEITGE